MYGSVPHTALARPTNSLSASPFRACVLQCVVAPPELSIGVGLCCSAIVLESGILKVPENVPRWICRRKLANLLLSLEKLCIFLVDFH